MNLIEKGFENIKRYNPEKIATEYFELYKKDNRIVMCGIAGILNRQKFPSNRNRSSGMTDIHGSPGT